MEVTNDIEEDASHGGQEDGRSGGQQDDAPKSVFPSCRKGRGRDAKLDMSTTMMQAYVVMRGHGTDKDDHLIQWIAEQEEHCAEKGEPSVLKDVEDSIKEKENWEAHGPATFVEDRRQSRFSYDRPKLDHIDLSKVYGPEELEEIYEVLDHQKDGWGLYATSYCSDDEGDGRISPCTFRRLAEGARNWDSPSHSDKWKSAIEPRKSYDIADERQRPPSPNATSPRRAKKRNWEPQYDVNDGRPMSGVCDSYVDTEPSVLWSPPPMKPRLPRDFYNHKIDRMDPTLARELRKGVATTSDFSWGVETTEEPEQFSKTEINAAVEKHWGVEQTDGIISEYYRDLANLKHNECQINATNERYRHEATRLKHENRKLIDCLDSLRSTRERRIMRSVQGHIRELSYQCKAKLAEIKARYRENEQLLSELGAERSAQAALLKEFGKDTAEEVLDMYPDIWEPLEVRRNRRRYS